VSQPAHRLNGALGLAPDVVNFGTELANYSAPDVPETQGGRHVSCISVVCLLHTRLEGPVLCCDKGPKECEIQVWNIHTRVEINKQVYGLTPLTVSEVIDLTFM
jgi:hypothetical protein